MRKSERETVADLTARAEAFGISVIEVTKTEGMNVMVQCTDGKFTAHLNLTRFADLVGSKEREKQLADYLAAGGTVKHFDPDVAHGVERKSTGLKRKSSNGGRKAEPISTGDAKFDMYLNALPQPVRVLVVPLGLDPRALYKEYRLLKKEGLIAKYDTEANRTAAAEKVGA